VLTQAPVMICRDSVRPSPEAAVSWATPGTSRPAAGSGNGLGSVMAVPAATADSVTGQLSPVTVNRQAGKPAGPLLVATVTAGMPCRLDRHRYQRG
jgi:hypothetical protein